MAELADERLVTHSSGEKYEGWEITRRGIRHCHLSWNIPSGMRFTDSRLEHDYSGWRHRRTSRLWRKRLDASWNYSGRYVEIWECWTELYLKPDGYPDALAWGSYLGQETLFWLEVDSGHLSRKNIILKYYKRIQTAEKYAMTIGLPVVFMVLGPTWVAQRISQCFDRISLSLAIISAPWMNSGRYPLPEFGDYCTNVIGILPSNYHNPLLPRRSLPFDPKKYR